MTSWIKKKIQILFYFQKTMFISLRHGINPFLKLSKNKRKIVERFTEKEKNWLINAADGYAKEFLQKMFDEK